ncbi:TPA: flagellar export chaperone FlgN [Proteus mirabilis]|nr:flagellar export chaperone FlgN [Proteus mirabilis]HEJ9439978.1 flagellar export chaperone FlgN [Proteus mirabilis]HEK1718387.1 flagellar export chaperone FlgN [Proteus mirabilis]HEK2724283.1 flagellar export chaperone FlgN [Proteus mirabilis]
MMEELRQTLDLQLSQLNTIAGILRAEQQLLCAGSIDINKLHEITEQKNFVLTALGHTDQKRQILNKQIGIDRPYQGQPFLADLWGQLVDLTEELKHLNQHNGLLLEQHITRNSETLHFLQKNHSPTLYGADGQAQRSILAGRKIQI